MAGNWVWCVRLWLISPMHAQKALPQAGDRWSTGNAVRDVELKFPLRLCNPTLLIGISGTFVGVASSGRAVLL